ncbi:MAG TPA: methyltransferase domain-containing protein [Candidatus Merdenecus merdavium]|nr:methyltransferase domain-containing protein [Candidatus Merdenecus merdavium]
MISSNAETIQKSFTEQAKTFETKSMCFTKQEYLKHMVSSVNPKGSDTVLEVAAGTCICGRSLAPFVQSVICLDMTPAMLEVGKDKAEKQGLRNINFVQGDAEKLPFLDNSFDLVISRLAFHHFPHPKRCFSEMARVLKAGGKLVIIDMEAAKEELRNTEDEIEVLRDPSHIRNLSKEEFTAMFREEHLTVTEVDVTEIPVSLSAWMALTNTPAKISADISKCFAKEIRGNDLTGFNPYQKDGEIYFNQRWVMIIGEKKNNGG